MEHFRLKLITDLVLSPEPDGEFSDEFSNEFKYSIGPQLALMSKDISDYFQHFQQQNATPKSQPAAGDVMQDKYIFFNHKNNRFHACFYDNESVMSHREGRKTPVSTSVMNLLSDLYAKEDDDSNGDAMVEKETIIKTFNDYWLCSKTFNNRSLYLILRKSSTLIDIAEESQRLCMEIVKNVYFTNQ